MLLGWIAAIGLPIAVHFLTRRSQRRMDLPTMRFVQKSVAQQSQLFKMRHWIVLLARALAVVCLVIAFARPVATSPLGLTGSGKKCAIVIIDDSASMGYRSGGVSTLDHARQDAINLLSGLHAGDVANVIVCDGHPHALLGEPGIDVGALRSGLQGLTASPQRADPSSAINMAVDQLGLAPEQIKQRAIYIASDFQRSNWGDARFDAVPSDVKIAFLQSDPGDRGNAGVTGMHLFPAAPHVGEPISVECEVFNSANSSRSVPVTLALSNGTRTSQRVTLAPYSSADATFPLEFDTPQAVECTASIPGDSLPADDTRRCVIDLQQLATVVLVTGESSTNPNSAAFYMSRALHPDASSNIGFHVLTASPTSLTPGLLHSADAVIVCNAPALGPDQDEQLVKYVTGGGNLVWMLYGDSPGQQLADFAKLLPPSDPAPLEVQSVADLTGNGKGYVTLAEAHYDSPLLKAFKDPGASDLTTIHFKKIALTSEVDPRADTLLKYDDGTAAAVRSDEGSGTMLLLNMSPAPSWSDLARQDAFLPLMHEFLKGLMTRDDTARQFFAGDAAAATLATSPSAGKAGALSCSGPDGGVAVTGDVSTGSALIDQTTSAGFYHILQGNRQAADIAVNISPDETDLRAIDPRELESSSQKGRSYFALSGAAGASARRDTPIWPYFLAAALVLLLGEQWLAGLQPRRAGAVDAGALATPLPEKSGVAR